MNKPHKHADLIKTWADGAEIQWRINNNNFVSEWADASHPIWDIDLEYRIKPKTIIYRLYLWKTSNGDTYRIVSVSYEEQQDNNREKWTGFVRWLSDWNEVEV